MSRRISRGQRAHLPWLCSPQGRTYGSLPALRAKVKARLAAMDHEERKAFVSRLDRFLLADVGDTRGNR